MPVDSMERTIREAVVSDIPALTSLFGEMFGRRPSEAWWKWKYRDHPIGALSMLCEVGGNAVAHCGGTIVDFRVGSKSVRAMQVVDVMSSRSNVSGVGGGSLFAKTTLAFFHEAYALGVRMVYGFPGERHHRAGERLFGYSNVGPVGELILDPVASDEEAALLSESDLGEFGLEGRSESGATRDPGWLQWRYLRHPEHRYERIAVRSTSVVRASAILQSSGETIRCMELGGSSDERSLHALCSLLARLGRPVSFWCSPEHAISMRLQRCGFRLVLRDHSVASIWYRDPSEWSGRAMFRDEPLDARETYYTLGDYDVY